MSSTSIAIQHPENPANPSILSTIHNALDRIRQRAYDLFEQRGGWPHSELEDWFRAERELFLCPDCELKENPTNFTLETTLSDFSANQLSVAIEDGYLTIHGASEVTGKSEYTSQELFRRLALPDGVDQNQVQAVYSDGVLKVTMAKLGTTLETPEPAPAPKEPKKSDDRKLKVAAASAA